MRLLTVSSSDTCYSCKGTGILAEHNTDAAGYHTVKLKVCSCVTTRVVRPKPFAAEVAKHMKELRK
jgi:hypothetical protein